MRLEQLYNATGRAFRVSKTLAVQSVKEFLEDNCNQIAAAISFYVLFSLFPLLIFIVGVTGILLQDSKLQEEIINVVLDNIPLSEEEGRDDVTRAIEGVAGTASGALGIFGLLGMAWSGSNMFGVIRRSINQAYDLEYMRPLVQQKLLDLAMAIGLGLFFLLSIGATAFLRTVREFSTDIGTLGTIAEDAGFVWDWSAILVPFALSFLAFLVFYWLVPNTKVRPQDVWPGALVAAILFEVGKLAFAIYLENFGNYDAIFGSLGAAAIFLFWVYISANILLFGAEVASEYPRVLRGDYEAPPKPQETLPLHEKVRKTVRGLFVQQRPKS
jgi:membrane protein